MFTKNICSLRSFFGGDGLYYLAFTTLGEAFIIISFL